MHNGITDRLIKKLPAFHALLQSNRGLPLLIIYIACSIALAFCAHRFFEGPLQNAARWITARLAEKRKQCAIVRIDETPPPFAFSRWHRFAVYLSVVLFVSVGFAIARMRQVQAANLFPKNPSFEQGLEGWAQQYTVKHFDVTSATFHTGGHSAHIETLGMQYLDSERFSPQKGSLLRVDVWAYVKRGAIRVMLLEGEDRKVVGETHDYATLGWIRLTFVTAVPLSGNFVALHIDDFHEPSDFYLDDVLIRPQW